MPEQQQLYEERFSEFQKAGEIIGADSLAYLSEAGILKACGRKKVCLSCFNVNYPTYLYHAIKYANKDEKF